MRRALLVLLLLLSCCGGSGAGTTPGDLSLAITPTAVPAATRDQPYDLAIATTGGASGMRTWQWVDGALPRGVGVMTDACPAWAAFTRPGSIASPDNAQLTEVSGIAVSRRNEGIVWVHDDGGGLSSLYALDLDGSVRQRYDLATTNTDWEDLAFGPGPDANTSYLYIADAGDNGSNRSNVHLLRVEEPLVPATTQAPIAIGHAEYFFAYPGGARDMEALFFDWESGTPYICDKNDQGGDVFRFPMPLDPTRTDANPVTLIAVTTGRPMPATITAGDATRDGRRVALRDYFRAYEYIRAPGQSFDDLFTQPACNIGITALPQYEALAYTPSGFGLVTTTERSVLPASSLDQSQCVMQGAQLRLLGTPRESGTFTFTIKVFDDDNNESTQSFTLTVEP